MEYRPFVEIMLPASFMSSHYTPRYVGNANFYEIFLHFCAYYTGCVCKFANSCPRRGGLFSRGPNFLLPTGEKCDRISS